jgi:TPP-dependent pyruvate/acetoin dehydrogenase alpha subunit
MNREIRRQLLWDMLRIRMVEESIAARYSEQEMRCPVHLSIGQEAVAVGVCAALQPEDYLMSTHRAHAHYLAKGGSLKTMIAEIYGKLDGCSSGKGGSMHLVDLSVNMLGSTPIVGSSMPVAVGTAFGSWMKGDSKVTVVFFGEATTEEGVFAECLNFASLKQLPVVFVCENNLYSVYSPMSVRQSPARDRVGMAKAHGMFGAAADGNDVVAVHELALDAVRRTRAGGGPSFIEFDTYRWREHCGPNYDNDIGYRSPDEFKEWRGQCPLERYQAALEREGAIIQADVETVTAVIKQEIDEAYAFAKASPEPPAGDLMSHMYANRAK